jgi:hypothetical protein
MQVFSVWHKETDLLAMEHQAGCGMTIETVTNDRCGESLGMSAMNTQLMCATRNGI